MRGERNWQEHDRKPTCESGDGDDRGGPASPSDQETIWQPIHRRIRLGGLRLEPDRKPQTDRFAVQLFPAKSDRGDQGPGSDECRTNRADDQRIQRRRTRVLLTHDQGFHDARTVRECFGRPDDVDTVPRGVVRQVKMPDVRRDVRSVCHIPPLHGRDEERAGTIGHGETV